MLLLKSLPQGEGGEDVEDRIDAVVGGDDFVALGIGFVGESFQ